MARISVRRKQAETAGADDSEPLVPTAFRNVIGYHLRIAQEASFQAFTAAADKADLRPGWYAILTVLAETDGLTPSALSRVVGRDRSTLTATLKGLLQKGLIERQQNIDDQRSYTVKLTAEGRRMQTRLHVIARRHDRYLDEIVGEDKAMLIALLARIAQAFGEG